VFTWPVDAWASLKEHLGWPHNHFYYEAGGAVVGFVETKHTQVSYMAEVTSVNEEH